MYRKNFEKKDCAERLIHIHMLDFVILPTIMLEECNVYIGKELASHWGKTPGDILKNATKNTEKRRYSIQKISEAIGEKADVVGFPFPICTADMPMYVIQYLDHDRRGGAACLLDKKILQEMAEKIKHDFYIIPSSVNEVIVVPAEEDMEDKEDVKMVIESVNEEMDPDDVLSYEPMFYSIKDHELKLR